MRSKIYTKIIPVLIILVWCSSPLLAQTDWTFSVNVDVKDIETKSPVDGANIIITEKITGAKVYSVLSNADQKVKLNLNPGNDYILKIAKNGYLSKTISISTRNVRVSDKTIPNYIFEVSSEIFMELPNEDYSAFRQVFGQIYYDESKKDFIWMPNPDAKQKEETLKESRVEKRKVQEKNKKKSIQEEGKKEIDRLQKKKLDAEKRALEREAQRKDDEAYKEAMRKEALESFNKDYDAPKLIFVKSMSTDTLEGQNYKSTITQVLFENGEKKVFRKIQFEWGGVYYKQDEYDLTDVTYNLLMKIMVLK